MARTKSPKHTNWHVYDLQIGLLIKKVEALYNARLKKNLLLIFSTYKKTYDLRKPKYQSTIITCDNPAYTAFLAIALVCTDENDVRAFLTCHYKKYTRIDAQFHQFLRFHVLGIVMGYIGRRKKYLNTISTWIDNIEASTEGFPSVHVPAEPVPFFHWTGKSKVLKEISGRLYDSGYTTGKTQFEKVFIGHKQITWLKDEAYLAFLINELYKRQVIECSSGKGFFRITTVYFRPMTGFYDRKMFTDIVYDYSKGRSTKCSESYNKVQNLLNTLLP